jgi:hypothetical protein
MCCRTDGDDDHEPAGSVVKDVDRDHNGGPPEARLVPDRLAHVEQRDGRAAAVVRVERRPGRAGFEKSLRVGYGLAADGLLRANGLPRNRLNAALMLK